RSTEGVTREPKSVEAHRAPGGYYRANRDAVRAEAEYKAAAAIAPPGSPEGLGLADFYLLVRQPEEAKQVLRTITEKAPEYLPAWRRLAEIAAAEQQYDATVQALRVVLEQHAP